MKNKEAFRNLAVECYGEEAVKKMEAKNQHYPIKTAKSWEKINYKIKEGEEAHKIQYWINKDGRFILVKAKMYADYQVEPIKPNDKNTESTL